MPLRPVGARQLTRRRYGQGVWGSDGRYVNTAATDTTFWGSFQPIARQLQREYGGERDRATHIVYARTDIRGSSASGGPLADRVIVSSGNESGTYEVESAKPYDPYAPIPHYEASLTLYNENDPGDVLISSTSAEQALQLIRSICKTTCTLADNQVVIQQDKMPRPNLPYIACLVDTWDEALQATDSQQYRNADTVEVTGGTTGDIYIVESGGGSATITREPGDTDTDIASAIATALMASGTVEAISSNSTVTIIRLVETLDTQISGSGPMDMTVDAVPATVQQGLRRGRINIRGYGTATNSWLERVRAYLASPAALQAFSEAGFSLASSGTVVPETVDLGTGYELRYACSVDVRYMLTLVGQAGTEAEQFLVDGTANSSGAQPVLPFTIEVP